MRNLLVDLARKKRRRQQIAGEASPEKPEDLQAPELSEAVACWR
jgi:DNA-directed RNA polymerase specialized sigma24 family protein